MELSKLLSRCIPTALLVLMLAAGGNAIATGGVTVNEGVSGRTAPPAEEGSAPPPPPVAAEDAAILVCPQGGGKNISYEVSSPLQGASCTKDSKKGVAQCTAPDGRVVAGATCKLGCTVNSSAGNGFCKESKGQVTQ